MLVLESECWLEYQVAKGTFLYQDHQALCSISLVPIRGLGNSALQVVQDLEASDSFLSSMLSEVGSSPSFSALLCPFCACTDIWTGR